MLRRIDVEDFDAAAYPHPIALVSAWDGDVPCGMLAAWWTPVSFKPPLMLVAVAPERYTYKLIMRERVYALNVLTAKHLRATAYAGEVSARFAPDKLLRAGLSFRRGEATGAPILEDALAAFELRLLEVHEAGDHDLLVSLVEAVYVSEGFDEEVGMWKPDAAKPLLYLGAIREDGAVRRYYLELKSVELHEVRAPPEELREAYERRKEMLREIRRAATEAEDPAKLRAAIRSLVEKLGLDELDLEYLYRHALRKFKEKRG